MYCGTSKAITHSSVPPITATATRMMAAISIPVRAPGPEVRADQFDRLTSPAPSARF
jgi:hypothetical protein